MTTCNAIHLDPSFANLPGRDTSTLQRGISAPIGSFSTSSKKQRLRVITHKCAVTLVHCDAPVVHMAPIAAAKSSLPANFLVSLAAARRTAGNAGRDVQLRVFPGCIRHGDENKRHQ